MSVRAVNDGEDVAMGRPVVTLELPEDIDQRVRRAAKGMNQTMTKTLRGTVLGRTIELDEDPGVDDGQEVEVQIKVVQPTKKWGEGILRTAGALVDDPYWDSIMEEVQRARTLAR
jgi:hypothetical protein